MNGKGRQGHWSLQLQMTHAAVFVHLLEDGILHGDLILRTDHLGKKRQQHGMMGTKSVKDGVISVFILTKKPELIHDVEYIHNVLGYVMIMIYRDHFL
jgi:hypothetical protein